MNIRVRTLLAFMSLAGACGIASAYEGRLFLRDSCPVSKDAAQDKEVAPLVTAFIGKVAGSLVGAAIDSIASALSEEKQVTVTATERRANWYVSAGDKVSIDPKLVCLIIVVADEFGRPNSLAPVDPVQKKWEEAVARNGLIDAPGYQSIRSAVPDLAKIGITSPPVFYLETRFVVIDGGSVFATDPRFVFYPNFIGEKVIFGPDTRDLLVQVEFSEPGADSPFAQTTFQFRGIQARKLTTERLLGMRMPWSKQPPSSGSGDNKRVPFNIKALFTESAKPGKLGTILAGVLKDQKTSIVAAAETKAKLAVSETERQVARGAAADAANTALTAYVAAFDAHETAVKNLATAKAASPMKQDAVDQAQNAEILTKLKLANAEAVARAAFDAAEIPFTPISTAP
jgi:hypothetical protein